MHNHVRTIWQTSAHEPFNVQTHLHHTCKLVISLSGVCAFARTALLPLTCCSIVHCDANAWFAVATGAPCLLHKVYERVCCVPVHYELYVWDVQPHAKRNRSGHDANSSCDGAHGQCIRNSGFRQLLRYRYMTHLLQRASKSLFCPVHGCGTGVLAFHFDLAPCTSVLFPRTSDRTATLERQSCALKQAQDRVHKQQDAFA